MHSFRIDTGYAISNVFFFFFVHDYRFQNLEIMGIKNTPKKGVLQSDGRWPEKLPIFFWGVIFFKFRNTVCFDFLFLVRVIHKIWMCNLMYIVNVPFHNTLFIQVLTNMDIGRTVRKAMKKLAEAIDDAQDRLSHDQIIHACSVSTPSIIGNTFYFHCCLIFCVFWICELMMCLLCDM